MLKKSTLREIRTSLARYIAIFSIVAMGVGFFAGLKDCKASMVKTAREYMEEHNFYDYQISTSYGADDDSVQIAKGWEGVSDAEGSVQIDVMAEAGDGDSEPHKSISLPKKINTLRLASGRLPEAADECVVDNYSATSDGYKIGDSIKLSDDNDKDTLKEFREKEFKIVGTVNTPVYLDYQRGTTDIGNGSLSSFFFISEDAYDVDYYSQLYVKLKGDEEAFTPELEDKLDGAEDSMKAMAEAINDARREKARKEAQDELDEKKKDYEEGLAEYQSERADAERQIADARAKLNDAEKTLDERESETRDGIRKLNSGIKEAEDWLAKINGGISKANNAKKDLGTKKKDAEANLDKVNKEKEELEQAYKAGLIDKAAYEEGMAKANAIIAEINEGIKQIDGGIKEADKNIKELTPKKTEIEATLSELKGTLDEAEDGLRRIDAARDDIADGRREINEQEATALAEFAEAEKELADAKDKIDEAQDEIDEMETGSSYAIPGTENGGYSSFDSNSSIVDKIAKIFPIFFFLIAALVCMTTMTRMIDEQRGQIGVLKALGYSDAAIAGKYLFYSGSAAFLGAVVGFFVGCKVFPVVIWNAYTMMYDFTHEVDYVIDPTLGLLSLAAALICSMGATWSSLRQDFKVAPADLIRPRTPPAGKRILLERIKPIWNHISFLYKVSIRNIFRDKKRFLMMVIGVSGCTALLIAGMGIKTTIAGVADYQYDEISLYDFVTIFSKNMNAERQADFEKHMAEAEVKPEEILFIHQAEVSVKSGGKSFDVTCTASDSSDFGRFINLHRGGEAVPFPKEGEVVIVRKIEHDYGIEPGDELTIKDGFKEMKAKVAGVCDNYVNDYIYMSEATYEKGFGKKPEIKTALVMTQTGSEEKDEDVMRKAAARAASYDDAAAVSVNLDVRDNVSRMMKSLDSIVYVVILSAALLAFIVLFNLTNINITERIREIATIKVLGFYHLETSLYVFRENFFMCIAAALVGIPLGRWLLKFVIDNIVVKVVYFEPRLTNTDIIISVILTFVFAFLVNLSMLKRLSSISMTESLKSVE